MRPSSISTVVPVTIKFNFASNASLTGAIDGEGDNNTLSFAGNSNNRSITLTGPDANNGYAGQIDTSSSTFTNIDVLVGGNGSDTLTGADLIATWEIDGSDRYLVGGNVLAFSNFELLQGGSLADSFVFSGTTVFAGSIDGLAGSDTLDYSAYSTARHVMLTGLGAVDGMSGTNSSISGVFTNIDQIIGTSAIGVIGDELYGIDVPSTWTIQQANSQYRPSDTPWISAPLN